MFLMGHAPSAFFASLVHLYNAIILRLQDVAQRGEVKGYIRALGSNTMKFFKVSPNIGLHEFGIFLEDKPTDEQRAMLQQQVQAGQAGGLLDIEDAIIIQNTDNLKVAQQLLAYKIKKRKEEEEAKAMQMQQMNAQVQQQSAVVAEQAKQQTIQVEGQVKSQLIQVEKEFEAKLLQMKYQFELQLEQMRQGGKMETKKIENKGKRSVTKLKMGQADDENTDDYNSMFAGMQSLVVPNEEEMQEAPEMTEEEMMEQQMMEQQMMEEQAMEPEQGEEEQMA